jgi:hypothetical protein
VARLLSHSFLEEKKGTNNKPILIHFVFIIGLEKNQNCNVSSSIVRSGFLIFFFAFLSSRKNELIISFVGRDVSLVFNQVKVLELPSSSFLHLPLLIRECFHRHCRVPRPVLNELVRESCDRYA